MKLWKTTIWLFADAIFWQCVDFSVKWQKVYPNYNDQDRKISKCYSFIILVVSLNEWISFRAQVKRFSKKTSLLSEGLRQIHFDVEKRGSQMCNFRTFYLMFYEINLWLFKLNAFLECDYFLLTSCNSVTVSK